MSLYNSIDKALANFCRPGSCQDVFNLKEGIIIIIHLINKLIIKYSFNVISQFQNNMYQNIHLFCKYIHQFNTFYFKNGIRGESFIKEGHFMCNDQMIWKTKIW